MPPPWQAPSEVEQKLYEAKARGDWAAYFDVLAGANLFHAMPREYADSHPGRVKVGSYWEPRLGRECYAFLTHGVLPAPVENPVFFTDDLEGVAGFWPEPDVWLAINPGTPCEAFFPATPAHRAVWKEHAQRAAKDTSKSLHTLWVGGPLRGRVAHGLACGALLTVRSGYPWNAIAANGSYASLRRNLKDWWDITSREDWRRRQASLLQESGSPWEFVLEIRQAIARQYGGAVDPGHWREVTARVMRRDATNATSDNGNDNDDGNDVEAEIRRLQQLIGRITRYEARFRADGLLGESKQVRSVNAWYFGRAVNMARWGVQARYCGIPEAEAAIIRASELGQASYHSWEDFSAGFILGRCLHFDEEQFGDWYLDVLEVHRLLVTDPQSPWLNIPWK
ncbi:DUF1266 domain-containing protein [Streptomyces triculaminicus]|uniref:DUF1266 domain-containing protein n=1 Tax=Streptomyces triculaminicus TaxID=2816232 RepID=UPI0037D65053